MHAVGTSVGIYRLPGVKSKVSELYTEYYLKAPDASPEVLISALIETYDTRTIASASKFYFRELDEPIFPFEVYDTLIAAVSHSSEEGDEDALGQGTIRSLDTSHLADLIQSLDPDTQVGFWLGREVVVWRRYLVVPLQDVTTHDAPGLRPASWLLPQALLRTLAFHLIKVSRHAKDNKMTPSNLGKCLSYLSGV
jgi:hypothetical protein